MTGLVRLAAEQWRREFAHVRAGVGPTDRGGPATSEGGAFVSDREADAFARAVLGMLAEPGDGLLGRLIESLGAVATAELLIGRATADRIVSDTADAGEALALNEVETGLARWAPRIDQRAFVQALSQAARSSPCTTRRSRPPWPSWTCSNSGARTSSPRSCAIAVCD